MSGPEGVVERTYTLESIGHMAHAALEAARPARVRGLTSAGIFIAVEGGLVLFVDYGCARGPLTLALNARPPELAAFQPGAAVHLSPKGLCFENGLCLSAAESAVWHPLAPAGTALPRLVRAERARAVAAAARWASPAASTVLDAWWALRDSQAPLLPEGRQLQQLEAALAAGGDAAAEALQRWLGAGRGLTPAGDDLVCGVLATLNRWRLGHWHGAALAQLNDAVVQAARRRTTDLGASLAACAAQGWAAEGLLAMLDGVIAGRGDPVDLAAEAAAWGASSGLDFLAGVAVAAGLD